ncbi:TauD/TfdA family dioxygenase [Vibrio harveyi]|uniref:TauD/TfdA family dioxygenase n=1 Tax=Vibrio harveyi TaxID=669 RepID=UPI003CF03CE4
MTTFINAELNGINATNIDKILDLFYRQGFVVVNGDSLPDGHQLEYLSNALNLGDPFRSDYNQKYFPNKNRSLKSEIGKKEQNKDDYKHPVFEQSDALEQHVDGTFSPLGEVKTTVLMCKTPALSGGDSTLFNAYGAIKQIESESPALANAFKDSNAFRRKSAFENIDVEFIDSAFGIDELYKREVIRLAFDSSADWAYGFERVPHLKEAYERLIDIKDNDSDFFLQFKLNKGDVIIMDNTRITHGRTSFRQNHAEPRMMIRSVHKLLPGRS